MDKLNQLQHEFRHRATALYDLSDTTLNKGHETVALLQRREAETWDTAADRITDVMIGLTTEAT